MRDGTRASFNIYEIRYFTGATIDPIRRHGGHPIMADLEIQSLRPAGLTNACVTTNPSSHYEDRYHGILAYYYCLFVCSRCTRDINYARNLNFAYVHGRNL